MDETVRLARSLRAGQDQPRDRLEAGGPTKAWRDYLETQEAGLTEAGLAPVLESGEAADRIARAEAVTHLAGRALAAAAAMLAQLNQVLDRIDRMDAEIERCAAADRFRTAQERELAARIRAGEL